MKNWLRKEMDWTTNNKVYNRCVKIWREHNGQIRCCWCSYHDNENWTNGDRKNWKRYRKFQERDRC